MSTSEIFEVYYYDKLGRVTETNTYSSELDAHVSARETLKHWYQYANIFNGLGELVRTVQKRM